ncbi:MAG: hypothetical protein AAFY60_10240, partial [Myxococcota bacterium]
MQSSIDRRLITAFFVVSLLSGITPLVLQEVLEERVWVIAFTVGAVLLVGIGVGATLARRFSGDLRSLSRFASRVSRGDLS